MLSDVNLNTKNWVVICHLAGLIGLFFPLGNIILPVLVWILKSDEEPELHRHGISVINFHISWTVYMIISGILVLIVIGLPFVIGLTIFGIVVSVRGVLLANEGECYQYPLSIKFLK